MKDQTTFPTGYSTDAGFDPAEDYIGPFYYQGNSNNRRYAFRAEDRHANVTNVVHGGVLMTFADYALCMEATNNYEQEDCVTISFNSEFVSGAQVGDLIESRASVTRKTGSLVFVTGRVFVAEETVLTYSAVVKRLKRQIDGK